MATKQSRTTTAKPRAQTKGKHPAGSQKRTKKPSAKPKRKRTAQRVSEPKKTDLAVTPRMKLRIVGIGGGGSTIVREIVQRVPHADFVVANTDAQALRDVPRKVKTFTFGQELTGGLGCGMDPELGEKAARAEKERIKKIFDGQDVCILVGSLGGGTGSGALPVFAQIASECKCLTLGVFTLPFQFEGEKRQQIAKAALERAKAAVNAYILIPNENIFSYSSDASLSFQAALSAVNRYLGSSLEGLIETIYLPGLINIDFADLKSLLEGRGKLGYVNSAMAGGPAKAKDVVHHVLENPLAGYGIEGTERMLFNIASDRSIKMQEMIEISSTICSYNPKAKIIFGISHQPKLRDKIRVTLFTAGCKEPEAKQEKRSKQKADPEAVQEQPVLEPKKAEKAKKKQKTSPKERAVSKGVAAVKQIDSSKEDSPELEEFPKIRRNGVEIKQAVDRELEDLEEKERQWEIPAFLRNRSV